MKSIELTLLIVAYSTLIITIFVSSICYKRKIENWETIAFSISLLLLIISITVPPLVEENSSIETTSIFTLLSMIAVGVTTPINVMAERQHKISAFWKRLLYISSSILFLSTLIAYLTKKLAYIEYVIVIFLGVSVILSMILIRVTKPQKKIAHLEKTNRIFAIAFLILVPISLLANYAVSDLDYNLKIGFTLPLIFIILAANKLLDDLQRLSLINVEIEPMQQHFKNYSLSEREKEIATLLVKAKTYKQISEELYISIPTVKTHTSNIYKKCKVNNRHELSLLIRT